MSNNLLHIETLVPDFSFDESEMMPAYVDWANRTEDQTLIEKATKIFGNTGIKKSIQSYLVKKRFLLIEPLTNPMVYTAKNLCATLFRLLAIH